MFERPCCSEFSVLRGARPSSLQSDIYWKDDKNNPVRTSDPVSLFSLAERQNDNVKGFDTLDNVENTIICRPAYGTPPYVTINPTILGDPTRKPSDVRSDGDRLKQSVNPNVVSSMLDPPSSPSSLASSTLATQKFYSEDQQRQSIGTVGSAAKKNALAPDRIKNPCKVFVGGIGQATVEKTIRSHFQRYGEILESSIVTHRKSGKSRGFGFITYGTRKAAQAAVSAKHKIDDVVVECREALSRDEARIAAPHDSLYIPAKVFVGGIPDTVQEDEFKYFFSQFGSVEDVSLAYDKNNHRPRGFGFVVFSTIDAANAAIGRHILCGRSVEVKFAVPRCRGTAPRQAPLQEQQKQLPQPFSQHQHCQNKLYPSQIQIINERFESEHCFSQKNQQQEQLQQFSSQLLTRPAASQQNYSELIQPLHTFSKQQQTTSYPDEHTLSFFSSTMAPYTSRKLVPPASLLPSISQVGDSSISSPSRSGMSCCRIPCSWSSSTTAESSPLSDLPTLHRTPVGHAHKELPAKTKATRLVPRVSFDVPRVSFDVPRSDCYIEKTMQEGARSSSFVTSFSGRGAATISKDIKNNLSSPRFSAVMQHQTAAERRERVSSSLGIVEEADPLSLEEIAEQCASHPRSYTCCDELFGEASAGSCLKEQRCRTETMSSSGMEQNRERAFTCPWPDVPTEALGQLLDSQRSRALSNVSLGAGGTLLNMASQQQCPQPNTRQYCDQRCGMTVTNEAAMATMKQKEPPCCCLPLRQHLHSLCPSRSGPMANTYNSRWPCLQGVHSGSSITTLPLTSKTAAAPAACSFNNDGFMSCSFFSPPKKYSCLTLSTMLPSKVSSSTQRGLKQVDDDMSRFTAHSAQLNSYSGYNGNKYYSVNHSSELNAANENMSGSSVGGQHWQQQQQEREKQNLKRVAAETADVRCTLLTPPSTPLGALEPRHVPGLNATTSSPFNGPTTIFFTPVRTCTPMVHVSTTATPMTSTTPPAAAPPSSFLPVYSPPQTAQIVGCTIPTSPSLMPVPYVAGSSEYSKCSEHFYRPTCVGKAQTIETATPNVNCVAPPCVLSTTLPGCLVALPDTSASNGMPRSPLLTIVPSPRHVPSSPDLLAQSTAASVLCSPQPSANVVVSYMAPTLSPSSVVQVRGAPSYTTPWLHASSCYDERYCNQSALPPHVTRFLNNSSSFCATPQCMQKPASAGAATSTVTADASTATSAIAFGSNNATTCAALMERDSATAAFPRLCSRHPEPSLFTTCYRDCFSLKTQDDYRSCTMMASPLNYPFCTEHILP